MPAGFPAEFDGRLHNPEETELTFAELLAILGRRWPIVTVVTLCCLAVGTYLTLVAPSTYRSAALIRLQDTQKTYTGTADGTQPNLGVRTDPLLSLLEVMRSELVLGDVADRGRVRLRDIGTGDPVTFMDGVIVGPHTAADTLIFSFADTHYTVRHRGGEARGRYGVATVLTNLTFVVTGPPGPASVSVSVASRRSVLANLHRGLSAYPRTSTDVVSVQFVADNPQYATAVLEEIVDAFQEKGLTLSRQQSQRQRLFVEEQLALADSAHAAAQLALGAFRSSRQLYSSQSRLAAEQEGLLGIDVRIEELEAERRFYDAVLAELELSPDQPKRGIGTLVASPGIASNPVVSQLIQQIIRYESQRDELTTGSGGVRTDHPDVLRYQDLIATTEGRLLEAVRSQLQVLDSRILALARLRERGAQQMRELPSAEAEEIRLVQEVDAARRLTVSLEAELQRARIAEAVEIGPVEILERAGAAGLQSGPGSPLILFMSLVVGLLLGTGSAVGAEYLNTTIKREKDLENLVGISGLGVIPRFTPAARGTRNTELLGYFPPAAKHPAHESEGPGNRGDVPQQDPADSVSRDRVDAFRTLRTNVIFARGRDRIRSAVVTSAVAAEGKTTTTVNLSIAFAQQGIPVLLVDADLRRPRLHEIFELPKSPGLTDVLLGQAEIRNAIRNTAVPDLFLITAGEQSSTMVELLGGRRMRQLLSSLRAEFGMVLLDSPPILAVPDAAILSVNTDGTLLVVHAGRTDRDAVRAAVQKLDAVGAQVVGAVLNDRDAKVPKYDRHSSYRYKYASLS